MHATSNRARILRNGVIAAAIAASGAFLSTAPATAEPILNPLITSTCTFAQVDAALHAVSPAYAAQLDRYPMAKAELQAAYDRPVADRSAALQRYLDNNPMVAAQVMGGMQDPRYADFKRVTQQVANVCHNY
ncbi:hemophore-related protein [Aldersonia kunmingensis]|uniref:hemophore-related protein n=1 Tax=Aldersonia kunmingensis TaxID=408066 RepID=UPI0008312426|nr:hemophore-related protein [Aldersonia kunmingensis]